MATWEKAFDTFQWENRSQSTNTPLDATHLNKVNDALDVIDDRVIELQGADADMEEEIAGKQDALTFDDVPTDGSNNPVKSNGIYDALNGKVDKNGTDRLMTADEGTKLAGIAAGAQVNVLEGVVVDSVEQPISGKKAFIDLSGKTDLSVIAYTFNSEMGYLKGAYVTYNGKLYEFTQEHQGAWNPSHVREINAAGWYVRVGNGGYNTGDYATTEGHSTRAEGEAAHAEGIGTIANSDYQHAEGRYNIADTDDKYALIVGNGTADNARSNAMTIDWKGNLKVSGDIADGNGDVTVEGNPVQFDSPFEQDAKSVVVSVKPIQDLHGYDHPWVGGAGKNKCPYANQNTDESNLFTINTADTYTFSFRNVGTPKYSTSVVQILDSNNAEICSIGIGGSSAGSVHSGTFTLTDAMLLKVKIVNMNKGDGGIYIDNMQLELGSSATPFAPYSNICPISGTDEVEIEVSDGESEPTTTTIPLPSTLYDADVDVTEGSANEDMSIFTDLSLLDWAFYEAWQNLPDRFAVNISSMLKDGGLLVSDRYPFVDTFTVSDDFVCNSGDGWLNIADSRFGNDVSAFKASLSGASMAYELATPTTISFDPTDVELLEGTNVVSTNAEKVAVTYGRSLWQDIDKLKTDTEGKLDKSDVATIEGDTASKAYAVNDFMLRSDGLYKVTQPIAQNASITSSNTTKTTVGEVLTALLNA